MRRTSLLACSALLGLLALPTTQAQAQVVLDQQNAIASPQSAYSVGNTVPGGNQLAQTFTVGIAGMLSRLDIEIGKEGGTVPLNVDVYGTTAGVPNPASSLAHFVFPAASVPAFTFFNAEYLTVNLGAQAFSVTTGQVLTLAVSAPNGTFANEYSIAYNDNAYTSGAAFARTLPNGTFQPSGGSTTDLGFRTYVDITPATPAVPEPGSVALLIGLTTTGAGFLSRRRRQQAKNAA